MANELRLLTKSRAAIKGTLTRFVTFVDKCSRDNIDAMVSQLESRFDNACTLLDKFNAVQGEIECLDAPDPDTSNAQVADETAEIGEIERGEFEDKYYLAMAKAKFLISWFYKQNAVEEAIHAPLPPSTSSRDAGHGVQNPNVRFPVIELPKFYGDYSKWGQFRDMFTSLVHNDPSLDNVKKFYYLVSCVKGDAAKIIENIEVTCENYDIAFNLLKSRYQNKYIIIKNHVSALLDGPSVNIKELHISLRNLTDNLQKNIRSLKSLGEPVENWDTLLFHVIAKKLDSVSQREWESQLISAETNNKKLFFSDLINFLEKRCILLETIHRDKQNSDVHNVNKQHFNNNYKKYEKPFAGIVSQNKMHCAICKNPKHDIFDCDKFKHMPIQSRYEEIKKLKLCTNCLRSGHQTFECKSQKCKKCGKHHNTLLHFERTTDASNAVSAPPASAHVPPSSFRQNDQRPDDDAIISQTNSYINFAESSCYNDAQVLLSTAVILIADFQGQWHEARVLLDNGSQPNLMTSSFLKKLNLPCINVNIPLIGVGNSSSRVTNKVNAFIKSKVSDFEARLSFFILNNINGKLPVYSFEKRILNIPNNLILADPQFNSSHDIDILLGATTFYDLLGNERIKLGEGLPILQESLLGWIVAGEMPLISHTHVLHCNFLKSPDSGKENDSLNESIKKFWEIEEVPVKQHFTKEEQECEDLYVQTVSRASSGNFIVTLPTRNCVTNLKPNFDNAVRCLKGVESRLRKNTKLRQLYDNFMKEYELLGHMKKVSPSNDDLLIQNLIYYLPHHCVYNEDTEKFRVVFNGSSRSESGISLNDALKVGPAIQDTLFNILLRFRGHSIVLIADIEKMYRMVHVSENQRNLQRILWRESPDSKIEHYQLVTVTYGTSSAAYQAIRSLRQVAIENVDFCPKVYEIIMNDFYVDDMVTGFDDIEEAISIKIKISNLLNQYGFRLRKWASNDSSLISNSADSNYHISDKTDMKKTLGLIWQANSDFLKYIVNDLEIENKKATKRHIFSTISKIYDPLGLLSPVTIKAKIMMQKLWETGLGWDDRLPNEMLSSWNQFIGNLSCLNNIKIPRHALLRNSFKIEIHGFSDASEQAYAACIYLKSTNSEGMVGVNLLCSKTRVAPLKTISVPRLELCGALLLAQLYNTVKNSLKFHIDRVVLWSDSQIVLSWLASSPGTWKIFVANRVSEIQTLTQTSEWRYVPTDDNCADIATKGMNPTCLENFGLWWNGPQWLAQDESFWPKINNGSLESANMERRAQQVSLASTISDFDIFTLISSWYKLCRIVALCIRFGYLTRKRTVKLGKLSPEEFENAAMVLIKLAQKQTFHSDISHLQNTGTVNKDSRLKNLNPFLDDHGFLRVGGRLSNSSLNFDSKHPLILAPKHPLTNLIIRHYHHKQLHAGPQSLLCSIRERFWLLNGRATVCSILRKCLTCFRVNPKTLIRKMADLPMDRVVQNRPFLITGCDFAGPFNMKDGKLRNRAIIKVYLCVFICFSTKAVHLEVVGDLSTKGFLNALKRFFSRRGICKRIYSDNGTNFVGASKELKHLYSSLDAVLDDRDTIDFFLQNSIEWKHIPPYSPHRGGLWEAAVKRVKFHLKRILGKLTLTYEDLATIFTQIEAVINSRPLLPLSSDPSDLSVLTPGHFLVGHPLTSIPQSDLSSTPANRLKQYELLQQAISMFWNQWSKEYLQTLQKRTKWQTSSEDVVCEGSLAVVIDDCLPPLYWRMGRILRLHEGKDGTTRTATLKTQSGEITRAIQKLCILPIDIDICDK